MNPDGKRVLITGASGGLGTATMAALKEKGCKVVGIDKVASAQFKGDTIVVDLMDERQTEDAVAAAIERLGGLDVLINNAGVLDLQDPGLKPTVGVREHLEINLLAPWRVTAAALPALIESRGRVVNVSSLVALVGSAYHPAYCSSKRALIAYSDVLRMQYADRITVTCVYPGYMATPIHRKVERQGLFAAKLVSFGMGKRTFLSLEEPLAVAARSMVRACFGRAVRNRCLTFRGTLSLLAASYVPVVIDWLTRWRVGSLVRAGMQVTLNKWPDSPKIAPTAPVLRLATTNEDNNHEREKLCA
jgi:NAD(P)-dependent dehydrogenase (short-subunit alcohol dehydrogenase family)